MITWRLLLFLAGLQSVNKPNTPCVMFQHVIAVTISLID